MRRIASCVAALILVGCVGHHAGAPQSWYAAHGAVAPTRGDRVSVCHGFGCHLKTSFTFSDADRRQMAKTLSGAKTAAQEREKIADYIAWAEKRVASTVGSADDVGGLDLHNARVAGQMDCIDEASNTTSYLMLASKAGLLRYHTIGKPVARGFFLDGRYPHATAVVVDKRAVPWAIDSWPHDNGVKPDVLELQEWFEQSPARWGL